MREILVALSLLLVIGVSIAVQAVGLSMALGTFLAGVLLVLMKAAILYGLGRMFRLSHRAMRCCSRSACRRVRWIAILTTH